MNKKTNGQQVTPGPRQIPREDSIRCWRLFDALDAFALRKFGHLFENRDPITPFELRHKVRRTWQAEPGFIEEFLQNTQLSVEDQDCVRSWEMKVSGDFLVLKSFTNFVVFFSAETKQYYAVKGLHDDFPVVFLQRSIPLSVEAVLYPYRDCIIWDGVIGIRELRFAKILAEGFAAEADRAVATNRIVTQL